MPIKTTILKQAGKFISRQISKQSRHALQDQDRTLKYLISTAQDTQFGRDHGLKSFRDHRGFVQNVPIADYEGHRSYVDQILEGKSDILWPGRPKYLAKTSGTTSGVKYIPITKESMPYHIATARNATMNMLTQLGRMDVLTGKVIFVSGSPVLDQTKSGLSLGRLSGIVNHEIPSWLQKNQMPSYATNCIEDWEEKVDTIARETLNQDMTLISGIPPWVQMYYERVLEISGKDQIIEVFPNYGLFVYGGVNYAPYRDTLKQLVGRDIPSLETYPASEGFIAFQDQPGNEGLLLNTNGGIFYEFVPLAEVHSEVPSRLTLRDVELGKDYAIILTTNAGLWSYNIGDTVRFVSLDPYRLVVSGRIKHFISAFGEHVIGKEVEQAMVETVTKHQCSIVEFSVAPQVNPDNGLPYHEWFVEWDQQPPDLTQFSKELDLAMQSQNIYYRDLIQSKILRPIVITAVARGAFRAYMETQGKLGGQNKVPRLSNDRNLVSQLQVLS